jgi:hypothetical protein
MIKIAGDFKALTLDARLRAYPEITAVLNAAKDARRLQLEAEIRSLGFRHGEGKRKPERAAQSCFSTTDGANGLVPGPNVISTLRCHRGTLAGIIDEVSVRRTRVRDHGE